MNLREIKESSTTTIGNAIEIVSRVMLNIAGNDISNKLGGNNITLTAVKDLSLARMNINLNGKSK